MCVSPYYYLSLNLQIARLIAKSVDPDQTLIRRRVLRRLIWVYTLCSGRSVRMLRVYAVAARMCHKKWVPRSVYKSTQSGRIYHRRSGAMMIPHRFVSSFSFPLLGKHAYSNVLKILAQKKKKKKWKFSDKKFWQFSYFCSKHKL